MAEPVPIEMLPLELRAQARPGTPMFKAYASKFEADNGLPQGTLSTGKYDDIAPGTDFLTLLSNVARGWKSSSGQPVPKELLPPGVATAAGAPANKPGGGERTTAMAPPFNPAEGAYPGVGPLGLNLSQEQGNAAAGFGKSFIDTARGVGQLGAPVLDLPTKLVNAVAGTRYTPPSEAVGLNEAGADATKKQDLPLMATAPGIVGNAAGTVAQTAVPSSALARNAKAIETAVREAGDKASLLLRTLPTGQIAQGAAVGAGYNALQPVGSDETRVTNTLEGGAAGGLGGALTGTAAALFRPAADSAKAAVAALADRARAMGISLRASQISDSPWLRWATTALDHLPFNGSGALTGDQHAAFNRVLSRTMGETSEDASSALKNARERLGGIYDALKAKYGLQLEPWHVDELKAISKDFAPKDVTKSQAQLGDLKALTRSIVNRTDDNGVISGVEYKALRSKIGSMANAATDPEYQAALKAHQSVLDKAFKSGLTPEDSALLDLTDKQWGNMRVLEGIAPKDAGGDWNFPDLARVMSARGQKNATNRNAFVYGQGDQELPDIAKIGTTFLNRGPGSGIAAAHPLAKLGKAAVGATELGAVGGGLYALNSHEESPVLDSVKDLGGLVLLSKLLGKGANSSRFAQGWKPGLTVANTARDLGLGQVPTGYLNAEKAGVPTDEYSHGNP